MLGVELDTLSTYIQYVLKGLFLAMINISLIYDKLTPLGLIYNCIMPFFISLILIYKADIIYLLLPFFINMYLLESINIKTEKVNILMHKILIIIKEYFLLIANFFNFQTLGGPAEPYNKSALASKQSNPNVNFTTSAGETPSGSGGSGNSNTPQGTGGNGNSQVSRPINRPNSSG